MAPFKINVSSLACALSLKKLGERARPNCIRQWWGRRDGCVWGQLRTLALTIFFVEGIAPEAV